LRDIRLVIKLSAAADFFIGNSSADCYRNANQAAIVSLVFYRLFQAFVVNQIKAS